MFETHFLFLKLLSFLIVNGVTAYGYSNRNFKNYA